MEPTVLLVDGSGTLEATLRRHLTGPWRFELHAQVDDAMTWLETHTPDLLVLDVDLQKGWNICTQMKRAFPDVPVIIVSRRFGRDVFVEHQKLETRADAYHKLPQDEDGLGVSLAVYATRRPTPGRDHSQSGFRVITRHRMQSTQSRNFIPPPPPPQAGGLASRYEAKAAEQAREIEKLKQSLEALEAERDAVREHAHRQAMQLMELQPGAGEALVQENVQLKQRVAQLESESLGLASRTAETEVASKKVAELTAEREALTQRLGDLELERRADAERAEARYRAVKSGYDGLAAEVEGLKRELRSREVGWDAERAALAQQLTGLEALQTDETVQVSTEILDRAREDARRQASDAAEQLARASGQLRQLAGELATVLKEKASLEAARAELEARLGELEAKAATSLEKSGAAAELERALAAAVARAETAESAWSAVNARLEHATRMLEERQRDIEQLGAARRDSEGALATSRRLMREYASEAGKKGEQLREVQERLRGAESELEDERKRADAATHDADFQRSLVNMLETELNGIKSEPPPPPVDMEAEARGGRVVERLGRLVRAMDHLRGDLGQARKGLVEVIGKVSAEFDAVASGLDAVMALARDDGPDATAATAADDDGPPPPPA